MTLVVPDTWAEQADESPGRSEPFRVLEAAVVSAGDVNRHSYAEPEALRCIIDDASPDVLDVHEEPFSVAMRQWLRAAPPRLPVVGYAAQNVDKRYPPPYCRYETSAYGRLAGLYPCSRQAASVARGKGFGGLIDVIPLGHDPSLFVPGDQSPGADEIVLGFVGRLVPEKGPRAAVEALAVLNRVRPARLVIIGGGPEQGSLVEQADRLGVRDRLLIEGWRGSTRVAEALRTMHVLLVPSRATPRWTEQFGRVIVEAQASGALVAGFASGSIPEVAGEAALLVEEGDAAGLATRVADVLADGDDVRTRREAGFALAADRTWARVADRQTNLYERACEAQTRPRADRLGNPRAVARAEFGPTAATPAGPRPFALPVLRDGSVVPAGLARLVDAGRIVVRRLPRPRP